jgi:hypothetical protein
MANISRFLDKENKVNQWPKKLADKQLVIEYLSSKFEFDHLYHETEINEILKKWHTFGDWSLLRREMYEQHYFDRNRSGTEYKRLK